MSKSLVKILASYVFVVMYSRATKFFYNFLNEIVAYFYMLWPRILNNFFSIY